MTTEVTESTTEIYFDGKICGSDPIFNLESEMLEYQAVFGTYQADPIIFNKKMIDVPVVCNYKQTVNGVVDLGAEIVIDEMQSKKVSDENLGEISVTAKTFAQKADKSYNEIGDGEVTLGQKVKIVFVCAR